MSYSDPFVEIHVKEVQRQLRIIEAKLVQLKGGDNRGAIVLQ